MLFGLLPACVMPFLIRRVGFQRAQYLTLTTQPVDVATAHAWGLVDAHDARSDLLLRRHLQRLRRLSKKAIRRYKNYARDLSHELVSAKAAAADMNRIVFSDEENIRAIARYTREGVFPWES
jgi:polyketide biosynthesis enoyl-CoA hydratase PksH